MAHRKKKKFRRAAEFNHMPFVSEEMEWLQLTPLQRLLETTKLWQFYLAVGGSLDPEPDSQSPFYFQET